MKDIGIYKNKTNGVKCYVLADEEHLYTVPTKIHRVEGEHEYDAGGMWDAKSFSENFSKVS